MLYPSLDELVSKAGNRYLLVNMIAKRAREIAREAEEQGVRLDEKPVTLAIRELSEK